MTRKTNHKITNILMIIGIALILISIAVITLQHIIHNSAVDKMQDSVVQIKSIIPENQAGVIGQNENAEMPAMEINGENFIGLLEVPSHNISLPIYSNWEKIKVSKFPCRYMGSVYEDNMIIGTNSGDGQFDIARSLSGGEKITIIDMQGYCYSYTVTDIYETKNVSTKNLTSDDARLVIFVKNSFSRSYIIIRCDN